MGGPGSGRWYRWGTKDTVDRCRRLDVREWHRQGLLCPGTWFPWGWWNRDGVQAASINVQVQHGQVRLSYRVRQGRGEWQDVEEPVSLTWTSCHYGGQRPWFLCPCVVHGCVCRRRVAILYNAGRYFLCRYCDHLGYASQREDAATRLIFKAQAIRQRLGGSVSLLEPFPSKPKGMHWSTYERLRWQAQEAEIAGLQTALVQLDRKHTQSRIQTL